MSPEIVSIIALVVIFAIATVFPINMGALAFVAAFLVGTMSVGLSTEEILGSDEVAGGFPSELVLTLIGVTTCSPSHRTTAPSTCWSEARCGWSAAMSRRSPGSCSGSPRC